MSTIKLKELLIEKIQKTDNENLLAALYNILYKESSELNSYTLTVAEKSEIYQAKNQINNKQSLTDDEANKEIEEWLNK